MSRVAFFTGLIVIGIALLVWIVRPNSLSRVSRVKFFGIELSSGVPAFIVMAVGLALMISSTQFPETLGPALLPPAAAPAKSPDPPKPPDPIKKIVCTGEHEGNCPGAHDIFYTCGYFGTDEQIAQKVCSGIKLGALRLKTVGGNKCGYALIEVTCQP